MSRNVWKGKTFEKRMVSLVPKALNAAAVFVEGAAKKLTPVDTGNLRGSITHKLIGKTGARVGTGTHYAAHVEFGTRRMAAQPYLRPAFLGNRVKINQLFHKVLSGVVK